MRSVSDNGSDSYRGVASDPTPVIKVSLQRTAILTKRRILMRLCRHAINTKPCQKHDISAEMPSVIPTIKVTTTIIYHAIVWYNWHALTSHCIGPNRNAGIGHVRACNQAQEEHTDNSHQGQGCVCIVDNRGSERSGFSYRQC